MAYATFAWVNAYFNDYYYYWFLDPKPSSAVFYYAGLIVVMIAFFFFGVGLSALLHSHTSMAGRDGASGEGEASQFRRQLYAVTVHLLPVVLCYWVCQLRDADRPLPLLSPPEPLLPPSSPSSPSSPKESGDHASPAQGKQMQTQKKKRK